MIRHETLHKRDYHMIIFVIISETQTYEAANLLP